MRVYKFLNAHFGLKSLYEKRLRISKIDGLNDPFVPDSFQRQQRNKQQQQ